MRRRHRDRKSGIVGHCDETARLRIREVECGVSVLARTRDHCEDSRCEGIVMWWALRTE